MVSFDVASTIHRSLVLMDMGLIDSARHVWLMDSARHVIKCSLNPQGLSGTDGQWSPRHQTHRAHGFFIYMASYDVASTNAVCTLAS